MSDQHHDRDTVVVREGGSSTGLILGIIAVIIVLAGAWYFLAGPGANTTSNPTDINVDVTLPSVAPAGS
jgi:FlaG/FlaF family flagellin (archaellin)